jgi:hypothetical protein
VGTFVSRGKPVFGPHGNHKLAVSTGSRHDKLVRMVQYLMAEERATQSDTGISEFWRVASAEEIASEMGTRAGPRRPDSRAATGARSSSASGTPSTFSISIMFARVKGPSCSHCTR